MAELISVAAVDDDLMLLQGLTAWLAGVGDLRVLAAVATVDDLLAAPGGHADVVLLDLRLRDGSEPARNVRRLLDSGARVLVISTVDSREQVLAAFEAGADGYLTKDHDLTTLLEAIRQVAAGGTAFSPELAFCCARDRRPSRPALSDQEQAVLIAYASGMTLQAAARRAGIRPGTAKEYLDRVKHKYRQVGRPAQTKIDLARRAREDGLTP